MNTKLTLSLNKAVTERAKKYAQKKKTSLSKLIENHLDKLTTAEKTEEEISPLVKSLSGVISTSAAKNGKDYATFLKKKYS